jgi:TfoX/Sxy family transcriptional regulator of competence genes
VAYDERTADRVRELLGPDADVRRMFGGIAFLVGGHMCCGVLGRDLVLRLGRDGASKALRRPGVRPMDFTGRPLSTMVYVSAAACRSKPALARWIGEALAFARSQPPKRPGSRSHPGRARVRGDRPGSPGGRRSSR